VVQTYLSVDVVRVVGSFGLGLGKVCGRKGHSQDVVTTKELRFIDGAGNGELFLRQEVMLCETSIFVQPIAIQEYALTRPKAATSCDRNLAQLFISITV
jgi:hypothetical protein